MKTRSPLSLLIKRPLMLGGLLVSLTLTPAVLAQQSSPQKQNQSAVGPIAGGGGYVSKNSKDVLERAKSQLNTHLSKAADIVFVGLPSGWTRERIMQLVSTIRISDKKPVMRRDDKALQFNYGRDENGEYIEALEPFFVAYASIPTLFGNQNMLNAIYRQIQLEILHEIVHLMGIGVTEATDYHAEQLAWRLIHALNNNLMICQFPEEKTQEAALKVAPEFAEEVNSFWIIDNLTGRYVPRASMLKKRFQDYAYLIDEPMQKLLRFPSANEILGSTMKYAQNSIEVMTMETVTNNFTISDDDGDAQVSIVPTGADRYDFTAIHKMEKYAATMIIESRWKGKETVPGFCRIISNFAVGRAK